MKITRELLLAYGAYPNCEQIEIFSKEWPDGVEVTLESYHRALALGLDLDWAARKLLPAPAQEAYLKAHVQPREDYLRAVAPFREAYQKAWETYQKAIAAAFCDAVEKEEGK